ncbi:MAG: DsbC family protein [Betaproteobacteria bacterium]|nr:DsbC family protein [Betaproteobacteria bacterium]
MADDAEILRLLEHTLGGVKIEGIQPGPLGLYEVRFRVPAGIRVVYTDAHATYVIRGQIFEAATGRDLTKERVHELNAVNFGALPLDQAITVRRGSGRRVLAMFADPHCPACMEFEKTLQQVDDVTIYVFMYPVIHPELADHSKSVWCSPDRAKAWLDVAVRGNSPRAAPSCDNPIEKNLRLAQSLGIDRTPTLILANGDRIVGGLSRAELLQRLDAQP